MQPARACPDAEDIAAFVDAGLAAPGRDVFLAHVSACSPCRELLSALARSPDDEVSGDAATLAAETRGPVDGDEIELIAGARVGRYIVLSRLGAGGMGVVYAAHDPELDRKVALKLLRTRSLADADRRSLHERLRREAQAMARLAHPHVVAVHDVGEVGDQVFLAMELVDGETLSRWLLTRRGWREIVKVYAEAGEGLAAAHDAGLVHRDFKPENVLVGKDGRVRVTDFGLARAAGAPLEGAVDVAVAEPLGEPVSRTRTGQVMGTPFYMAPEQYLGGVTDARSDQFSFCVALATALTGEHPLVIDGPGGLLEGLSQARLRGSNKWHGLPRRLRRVLTRGLSAEPSARYASMRELLAALRTEPGRRWLWLVAVVALAGAGFFALRSDSRPLLCTGAGAQLVGVWDEARAGQVGAAFLATGKPFAAAAAAEVKRVLDQQTRAWAAMHTEACQATRVRGEQPESMMALRMACLDDCRREIRALTAHLVVADAELVERAPRMVHALGDVASCAGASLSSAPPPADLYLRARVETLRGELTEVIVLEQAGKYPAGCERARRLAADAAETQHRPLEAEVQLVLGRLERACGDDKAATAALERAVWAAEASRQDQLAARGWLELMRLFVAGKTRYADALALEPRITAALERVGGDLELEGHLNAVAGRALHDTSRYAEARQRGERSLALLEGRFGVDDLRVSEAVLLLGDVAYSLGGADAAPWFERDLALKRRVYGADHPEIARSLRSLARVRHAQGEYQESCRIAEEALQISLKVLGPEHRLIASHLNDIASCSLAMGDWARGEELVPRILAIDEATIGKQHVTYAVHLMTRSWLLMATYRGAEAVEPMRESLAVLELRLGGEDARVAQAHEYLARALWLAGRAREALREASLAMEILEKKAMLDEPYTFRPRWILAEIALELGMAEKALPLLERARELAAHVGVDSSDRAEVDFALARALVGTRGDVARAEQLAASADAVLHADKRRPREATRVRAWLSKHRGAR